MERKVIVRMVLIMVSFLIIFITKIGATQECTESTSMWLEKYTLNHTDSLTSVDVGNVDDDERYEIVTGSRQTVRVWNFDGIKWNNTYILSGHSGSIRDIAVGDVDLDGQDEIITGSRDDNTARIWDFDGNSWVEAYTLTYESPYDPHGATSIDIGNLDTDGYPEIVTGDLHVNIWDWNGTMWVLRDQLSHSGVIFSVIVGNIDEDKENEIVSGSFWNKNIKIWDWNGTEWTNSETIELNDYVESIAVGDVDNDAQNEIVVGLSGETETYGVSFSRAVVLDWDGAKWLTRFIIEYMNPYDDPSDGVVVKGLSVAIGNLDKDIENEIITGSKDGTVRIWKYNGTGWSNIKTLYGHLSYVNNVIVRDIVNNKNDIISVAHDGTCKVWVEESFNHTDSDGDGVPDVWDQCPNTTPGLAVHSDGCSADDPSICAPDYNGDGVVDTRDRRDKRKSLKQKTKNMKKEYRLWIKECWLPARYP